MVYEHAEQSRWCIVCYLLHAQATQEKKQNDDYDDSDKGSHSGSGSDSSHGSDDESEIEGVDIPAPAQSAPVPATGSVPRAGPPDAGKDVLEELPLSIELSLGQRYHNLLWYISKRWNDSKRIFKYTKIDHVSKFGVFQFSIYMCPSQQSMIYTNWGQTKVADPVGDALKVSLEDAKKRLAE